MKVFFHNDMINRPGVAWTVLQTPSSLIHSFNGHATAQNFSDLAQNLEICMRKLNIYDF